MNYEKFLKVSATAIFSMVLAACGGGGGGSEGRDGGGAVGPTEEKKKSGQQITGKSSAVATPFGLANLGSTCFINATLQILRNDPVLRSKVEADHPGAGFKEFFDVYEARGANLSAVHAKVTRYIRGLEKVPSVSVGAIEDVMEGLGFSMINLFGNQPSAVMTHYEAGERYFTVNGTAKNGPLMKTLPSPEKVNAFGYYVPGHVYAYVRHNDEWYKVDDKRVEKVSVADMEKLDAATDDNSRGISSVFYR